MPASWLTCLCTLGQGSARTMANVEMAMDLRAKGVYKLVSGLGAYVV